MRITIKSIGGGQTNGEVKQMFWYNTKKVIILIEEEYKS